MSIIFSKEAQTWWSMALESPNSANDHHHDKPNREKLLITHILN